MDRRIKEVLRLLTSDERKLVETYIQQLERENFGLRKTVAHCKEKEEKWYGVQKGDKYE